MPVVFYRFWIHWMLSATDNVLTPCASISWKMLNTLMMLYFRSVLMSKFSCPSDSCSTDQRKFSSHTRTTDILVGSVCLLFIIPVSALVITRMYFLNSCVGHVDIQYWQMYFFIHLSVVCKHLILKINSFWKSLLQIFSRSVSQYLAC